MNLVTFLEEELRGDDTFEVRGSRAVHILEVHGAVPGRRLRVGQVNGKIGWGVVRGVGIESVTIGIEQLEETAPSSNVDLVLALPRPQILKKVLQTIAAMGVGRLMLLRSSRVEKSYFSSRALEDAVIQQHLRLGLEQGVGTKLPEVSIHSRFKPFVEDTEFEAPVRKLLAHPEGVVSLAGLHSAKPVAATEQVVLAIGPEGGWVPYEVELFQTKGYEVFHCGRRVLRVETAVSGLLSQLELLRDIEKQKPIRKKSR